MHYLLKKKSIAIPTLALAAEAPSHAAQENTFTITCQQRRKRRALAARRIRQGPFDLGFFLELSCRFRPP